MFNIYKIFFSHWSTKENECQWFWDLPRNHRPYKKAVLCLVSKQELVGLDKEFWN